jgi:hypothetical protein
MNKQELRAHIEAQTHRHTVIYGNEIPVHAPKAPVDHQRRVFAKQLETRKKPAHLLQEEWEQYLRQVEQGTYRPQYKPETDLYDYDGL